MPILELQCSKCNKKVEVLVKDVANLPSCKECGEKMNRVYGGTTHGAVTKKTSGCTGNCATCGGCK